MRERREHPYLALPGPWVVAHRGGSALAPENTLVAFESGVRHGAVCLETDVRLTRDGVVVIFHDDDTRRITGAPGTIEERTLDEVRRLDAGFSFSPDGGRTFPWRGQGVTIPTLREAVTRFPAHRFNLEAKSDDPALAEALVATVRRLGLVERSCIGSGLDLQGPRIRRLLPEACHFLPRIPALRHVLSAPLGPAFDWLAPGGWDVGCLPPGIGSRRLLTPPVIARLSGRGVAVFVWTIDDEDEMRDYLAAGVHGVMTDRPDRLARVVGELGAGTVAPAR